MAALMRPFKLLTVQSSGDHIMQLIPVSKI